MKNVSHKIKIRFICSILFLIPLMVVGEDQVSDAALLHAKELLRSTPLIDGHNDLPWLIRDLAGIDHVGIGSDYWGMPDMPIGLEDVSGSPRLFAILIQRGWSDEDLRKLAGQNMLRVMRETESVAQELQNETATEK